MATHDFAAPTLEELARLLPAYDFEMLIAKGGMGAVYRAKQRSLARDVAIKVLPREVGMDPMFRQSFETEARAMARLNHPNLIGVYDSGAVDGMLYIVMEYVPGKSLYHSAYGKKVDPKQAVELIQGICSGLGHAHENGIIHRDIKPANVLLTPKAEPKIGDFGLARPVEAEGSGLVMGTPGYSAPELFCHPQVADRRSDLFAVGVILYELLTGQRETADSPPPSSVCGCGTGMDDIWRRATHANPEQRFQDAAAFKAALARWLEGYLKAKSKGASQQGKGAVMTKAPAQVKVAAAARPPAPAAGGPPAPPAGSPSPGAEPAPGGVQQVQFEMKTNWHFIRNLFIIAVLIIAVAVAWKKLETARAIREADEIRQRELQAEKEAKMEADARERAREILREHEERQRNARNNPQATGTTPGTQAGITPPGTQAGITPPGTQTGVTPQPDPPKPEVKPETPVESLMRLRLDLVNGKRDEMPIGVVRRGDCDFMMVPTPMTWADAAWYAERFGGHLATPNTAEDITWLERLAPGDSYVWLGAGRSSREDWTMLDGKRWGISPAPKGLGSFLGVGKFGMKTFDSRVTLPCIIQWHRNGSNPASMAAALQAARDSLGEANPIYPPGTVAADSRHFLYVARPLSWRDAVDMAERSGGHLAVVSSAAEAAHLEQLVDLQVAPDGVWLGGFLKGQTWVWLTGEPWTVSKWAKSPPTDGSLALMTRAKTGWDSLDLSLLTSGFVIEWSGDRDRGASAPLAGTMESSAGSALTVKAKELLLAADRKRLEQFASNTKTFIWDLDVWMRGLSGNERATWEVHVMKLKALVRNNRVPAAVPEGVGINLSPKMSQIAARGVAKQQEINQTFLAEAAKIRTAYQAKLRTEVMTLENAGKIEQGAALRAEYRKSEDIDQWLKGFGIDPAAGAPLVAPAPE
jgi:hypothetical protein